MSESTSGRGPLRVLIAEDETIVRLDLRAVLETHGLVVCGEARDGIEAVAQSRQAVSRDRRGSGDPGGGSATRRAAHSAPGRRLLGRHDRGRAALPERSPLAPPGPSACRRNRRGLGGARTSGRGSMRILIAEDETLIRLDLRGRARLTGAAARREARGRRAQPSRSRSRRARRRRRSRAGCPSGRIGRRRARSRAPRARLRATRARARRRR